MPDHIIHKQTLLLVMDREERANEISETVRRAYYDKVLGNLDDVFSGLAPDGRIYRFDRLEVDLGQIDEAKLEADLSERLPDLIARTLSKKIERHRMAPEEDGTTMISGSSSLAEAFAFYLEHGRLPWWFAAPESESPEKLFDDLTGKSGTDNLRIIARALSSVNARRRLDRQFSDQFITSLIQKITTAETTEKPREIVETEEQKGPLASILMEELWPALEKMILKNQTSHLIRVEIMGRLSAATGQVFVLKPFSKKGLSPKASKLIRSVFTSIITALRKAGQGKSDMFNFFQHLNGKLDHDTYSGSWLRDMINEKNFESMLSENMKAEIPSADEVKKEDEPEEEAETGIFIRNAGLVLLWPFLKNYFNALGLLSGEKFNSMEDANRAAMLLQYACTGSVQMPEYLLPLNKLLCGLPMDFALDTNLDLTRKETEETEELLKSVAGHWKAIGKVSPEGLRVSFLQREGRLNRTESGWSLKVERKTWDLLLDKLPWMISMVKLNWMKQIIYVEW